MKQSVSSLDNTTQPVRGRIVAAARRHFLAHGFRGVTMGDLATELGMSKKTVYSHFESKTDLVKAVLADKLRNVEADLEPITAHSSDDFHGTVQQLLLCVQGHAAEIQPSFVRDIRRDSPELFKLIQVQRRKLIQRHFGKLLKAGRRAGLIRTDISSRMIVEILLAAVESIANPTRMAELGLTPKTALSAILSVFFNGIVSNERRARP
jgi:AcrR family transcriptional regulator